ncbi:MAG: DUF1553 domain-containing protein [Aureliella sp.]
MKPLLASVPAICSTWILPFLCFGADSAERKIEFERDVRPILSDKCVHCHGPDSKYRQADLRLDQAESAEYTIEPGDPESSELIARILSDDAELLMPPPEAKKPLSEAEKATLMEWIRQGAEWRKHWSFETPEQLSVPTADGDQWSRNSIDHFILDRLKQEGVTPSGRASKTKLIRRLTYDLTGLPPTIEEVDSFLADTSDQAYEHLVDRLLASKHYGERMAVMWLDAARYGDTSVYHADGPRDMWAWRDTVVKAYNENMPFDRFSIAQLAADYLPDASLDEKILGGFNRNNGTTDEGGAFAEEYRVEYCVDRVKTTSTIWLGLTMECAQCHDHKYDPISQKEYYEFYAFFNVSADGGMQTRNGNAEPTLPVPDPAKEAKLPQTEEEKQGVDQALATFVERHEPEFHEWLKSDSVAKAGKDADESSTEAALKHSLVVATYLNEGKGRAIADRVTEEHPPSRPGLRPIGVKAPHFRRKGKLNGKVNWVETPQDRGLKFDGSNFVDFGDVGDFERDQSFTLAGWAKINKGTGAVIARMEDGNSYRGYDLYAGPGGLSMHVIHSWPDNAVKVTSKQKPKMNQWYHFAATYDGTSKASGIHLYIDGKEVEWNIEQDGLTDTIRTERSLLIGSRHPGSRFQGEIDAAQVFARALDAAEVEQLAQFDAIRAYQETPEAQRTKEQFARAREKFFLDQFEEYKSLKQRQKVLTEQVAELKKPLTTVMVMRDMQKPRDTFILSRGAYDSPTEVKVSPSTPAALPAMDESLPRNRFGLAQWLFSDEQPLTARVTVNRYWQLFFGRGLVNTPQDFGAQGAYPTHPELLDWLANDFRENGWNIKRLVKQIVMSATYQQDSAASAPAFERDPQNVLLARGPRFRLQAEFIRDTALALSGNMNFQFGGPGVKPYQPKGLWVEVGLSGKPAFVQDHGNKLYRRSLYTYWKRSAPPPTMQIFDAPTREKCTLQRARTNTPLQALVVLNDPQFVEASRGFAQRLMDRPAVATPVSQDVDRLIFAFRSTLARTPNDRELAVLLKALARAREHYQAQPEDAGKLLQVGEAKPPEGYKASELAAWTNIANMLLNLDEALTRE